MCWIHACGRGKLWINPYLSYYWAFDDQPIAAYYGANNDGDTNSSPAGEPYLVSVEDRISAAHGYHTRVAPAAVYQLTAVLQNTGVEAWSVAEYAVGYCWEAQCAVAGALPAVMAPGSPSSIAPGKAVTVTLNSSIPGGTGCLSLDLYHQTGWSYGWLGAGILGEPGWRRQPLDQIIITACKRARLPLITHGAQ